MRNIFFILLLFAPSLVMAAPAGPGIGDADPGTKSANSLRGTHWELTYRAARIGTVKYVISFLAGGKLRHTHPYDKTVGNDNWSQDGNNITIRFENGYSTYTGRLVSANTMEGTARNVMGQTWTWSAVRLGRK